MASASRHASRSPRTTRSSSSIRRRSLPYGAKVVATVAADARRAPMAPRSARPRTGDVPDGRRSPSRPRRPRPRPIVGGLDRRLAAAAARSAAAAGRPVERYYLSLMNCTRTGGWVTSGGDCSSPGGRSVAPLRSTPGSAPRSPPVRQEAGRQQHVHAFQRRQSGRSPAPRRLHELSLGGEPRLPVRATRTARCSAAIASSRASSRTAAATT